MGAGPAIVTDALKDGAEIPLIAPNTPKHMK